MASVKLRQRAVLPNKDFILRYDVTGGRIEDAVLLHRAQRGGFFTLILQPPDRVTAADVTPKELVFVLDTSGSMSGFPIEKAKETMKLALQGLYPRTPSTSSPSPATPTSCSPSPCPPPPRTCVKRSSSWPPARRRRTEMMRAIRAALDPRIPPATSASSAS